jgi:hypothetical protein
MSRAYRGTKSRMSKFPLQNEAGHAPAAPRRHRGAGLSLPRSQAARRPSRRAPRRLHRAQPRPPSLRRNGRPALGPRVSSSVAGRSRGGGVELRQLAADVGAVGQEPGHRREQHEAGHEGPHPDPDASAIGMLPAGGIGRLGVGARDGVAPRQPGPAWPRTRRAFVSPSPRRKSPHRRGPRLLSGSLWPRRGDPASPPRARARRRQRRSAGTGVAPHPCARRRPDAPAPRASADLPRRRRRRLAELLLRELRGATSRSRGAGGVVSAGSPATISACRSHRCPRWATAAARQGRASEGQRAGDEGGHGPLYRTRGAAGSIARGPPGPGLWQACGRWTALRRRRRPSPRGDGRSS